MSARWQAYDGRGLKAPADCVDFAVVDMATGREIARVWTEDSAVRLACMPDLCAEAAFLIERLAEFENENTTYGGERDWNGHVLPSISRLRELLSIATPRADDIKARREDEGNPAASSERALE